MQSHRKPNSRCIFSCCRRTRLWLAVSIVAPDSAAAAGGRASPCGRGGLPRCAQHAPAPAHAPGGLLSRGFPRRAHVTWLPGEPAAPGLVCIACVRAYVRACRSGPGGGSASASGASATVPLVVTGGGSVGTSLSVTGSPTRLRVTPGTFPPACAKARVPPSALGGDGQGMHPRMGRELGEGAGQAAARSGSQDRRRAGRGMAGEVTQATGRRARARRGGGARGTGDPERTSFRRDGTRVSAPPERPGWSAGAGPTAGPCGAGV